MADVGLQYTLGLVKPDAVKAGHAAEVCQLAEMCGFTIVAKQLLQLTPRKAEEFYAEHKEKAFFPGLCEFMCSGPLLALCLARDDAVAAWRRLLGPTNSFDARLKSPKSLRALFGTDGTRNAVHGSDSPESAARELRFFFPELQLGQGAATQGAAAARDYIAAQLQRTLVQGLTVLAREKPSSQPLEAVAFLAHWLLANNPNKPKQEVPSELAAALEQQRRAAEAAAAARAATEAAAAMQRAAAAAAAAAAARGPRAPVAPAAVVSEEARQGEAATKVQAAFRGHQARKAVAEMRAAGGEPAAVVGQASAEEAAAQPGAAEAAEAEAQPEPTSEA